MLRNGDPDRSHRRPSRASLVGALVVGLVLLGAALHVWTERARVLDDGQRTAGRLAHVLEEQTARSFQAVDLTLVGIADALRLTPALPDHDPAFEDTLRRKRTALLNVRALFVIGVDGFITQDTDHPHTPRVTLADRGYFRAHAEDPRLGLHVGPPLISRSVATWFVSLSRRIDAPDGTFRGVAVAAVEPRYFGRFYQELQLGKGDSIALFQRDGTLIARAPHHEEAIAKSFAFDDLFQTHLRGNRLGTYRSVSPVDGIARIFSYRIVEEMPLVVAVGLGEETLLAGWRRQALGVFAATAAVALLVSVVVVLVTRQAQQRAEAQERLAQAQRLEALGRMTGGIAHDFGNVLAAVSNSLAVALRTGGHDDVRRPLEAALRAVTRGTRMASQLLAFARRQEMKIGTVDANRLVSELKDLLVQAASPSAEVVCELAPDLWECRTDESQFAVAVLNLVVNARQALTSGTGQIRIVTENCHVGRSWPSGDLAPGDYVRVTVSDSGSGMPPDVLRQVTEPFYTTRREGTGLGLSQVYGFVKQVGGDLHIESEVGVGTSVHLYFLRAIEDRADVPGAA